MNSHLSWIEPILERYERPLLLYAMSLGNGREAAQDAVQETFIRLAKRGGPPEDRLAPWLFTVCRNWSLDLKKKGKRILPMNEEYEEIPTGAAGPDDSLAAKDQADQLSRLLKELPEAQREVIRLRFQCDLSYREISEVTSLSIGHVGVLLHHGLKRLRQLWPESLEVKS